MKKDPLVHAIEAKSARQVMAEFLFALGQLVIYHRLDREVTELSVNFHGPLLRVDMTTVTPDAQHIDAWLLGLNANVLSAQFGEPVPLPAQGGTVQ